MNKKNNDKKLNMFLKVVKFLPIILIIFLIAITILNWDKITVENIIEFTPKNPILGGLFILLGFFIKSITIIFPIAILNISSGKMFSFPIAILLNSIGLMITIMVPFLIGRYFGNDLYEKLIIKYPNISKIEEFKNNSQWFFVILSRLIKVIPGDITSMVLGSMSLDFLVYLSFSFLVRFPPMLSNTFLGSGIQTKNLTGFFISTGFTLLISIVSGFIFYRQEQKKAN